MIRIDNLFRDNKKTRALYIDIEFRDLVQGDMSVTDYCLRPKTLANALDDVGQTVSEEYLVLMTLKGLNPKFDNIAIVVPLLSRFPDFLQVRYMLLL